MNRAEALELLARHRLDLARFQVKSLAIFGLHARDEMKPGSDVDVLVEFEGPATFASYTDLKFFLEDLLGHPVDLVTRRSLHADLASYSEQDALYVT